MNTIYRIIWNAATAKWVVASELAKGRKKSSTAARLISALTLACATIIATPVFAETTSDSSSTCAAGESMTASGCVVNVAINPMPQSRVIQPRGLVGTPIQAQDGNYSSGIASASNRDTIAAGSQATASGPGSTAVGAAAKATALNTSAFGLWANASQAGATALGYESAASGVNSVAIGSQAATSGLNSTAIGQLSSATAAESVALGSASVADRANTISVGSSTTQRQIVNVAAGTQAMDAVNISQLTPAIAALGGGAAIDATTGVVTGPTYTLANGGAHTTVGGALTSLDTAVTKNTGDITSINTQLTDLADGTAGLVKQDVTTNDITVASATGGNSVNFGGSDGARKLGGVANGIAMTDAVNVSQLAPAIAALGGGASINATTGVITGPTYVLANGGTSSTIGDALSGLDTSLTNAKGDIDTSKTDITNIQNSLATGGLGLLQQSSAGANLTVGAATDGNAVDFTGTNGARLLSGVANAVDDNDAVTLAQLKATGLVDKDGKELGALVYDDLTLGRATLGGNGGTILANIKGGLIAQGSMEAINGGQMWAMQEQVNNLSDRVNNVEEGLAAVGTGTGDGIGSVVGSGDNSTQIGSGSDAAGDNSTATGNGASATGSNGTATGANSSASGENSTATGAGSIASGDNSTATGAGSVASGSGSTADGANSSATGNDSVAIGHNASAPADNSVALGANSVADRENTVSVGSPGNERQITNVAAGTAPTDAVNVQQLQNVQNWAQGNFDQLNNKVDKVNQRASAGTASALAVANMPQAYAPGQSAVSAGLGSYNGQSAMSVGISTISEGGRWMFRASGTASTQGDMGVGVGAAFTF